MAQPFNCVICGTLRPSNAHFCKKCGRPFAAQRVSPLTQRKHQTQQISAPAQASMTTGQPKKPAAPGVLWQKVLVGIIWAVVTLVLVWFTLQRSSPVKADYIPDVNEPERVTSSVPAVPPDVEKVYHTEIKDHAGKVLGIFDILLLSKRHVWVSGSIRLVKNLGDITGKNKTPFSLQLNEKIINAPEVIVIGTADEAPLAIKNNPLEVRRADDRSNTLYQVVLKMKDENEQAVFKTNFGQWTSTANEAVSYDDQRRIIIVEVRNRSTKLPLNEGLRQALEQYQHAQPIFFHLLNNYSKSRDFEVF